MKKSIITSVLACVVLHAAPAFAQSLSMQYQARSTTGGASVTITVKASPLSMATVFISAGLQPGFAIPGLGNLHLDPMAGLIPLGTMPVGLTGQAQLRLPLPRVDFQVFAQALVVDARFRGALTKWCFLGQAAPKRTVKIGQGRIDANGDLVITVNGVTINSGDGIAVEVTNGATREVHKFTFK